MADTPYSKIEALVIDDMATQQTTLRGQLAMLGIERVDAAGSAEDALKRMRAKPYQLILCDYNLNHRTDGQQLFEYLREHQLLSPDTLFFMVTAEANYNSVASASEHLPDAYLLKPITAGDIEDRLRAQLDKRQALLEINRLVARKELAAALLACDEMMARKDRWFLNALQIKAQLQLELGQADEARQSYEQVLALRSSLVWAQVGLARACKAAGDYKEARRLCEQILQSRDGDKNLAAFDLLAQCLESLGDGPGSLEIMKQSAQIVPSARRQRALGECAYRNGDMQTARASMQKALRTSLGAITAQDQDSLMLAQIQIDMGEAEEALRTLKDATAYSARKLDPDAATLALRAQAHAQQGQTELAGKEAAQALAGLNTPKADFAAIAVARAALMSGREDEGLALMRKVISADHENMRVQQLVGKALRDTGHSEQMDAVIGAATAGLKTRLHEAKRLLRAGQLDEALQAIEAELAEYPENSTVLLECAQMNCLYLRLNKRLEHSRVNQVRDYLARLEKLLPGHERVAQMRRYLRETLAMLQAGGGAVQLSPER